MNMKGRLWTNSTAGFLLCNVTGQFLFGCSVARRVMAAYALRAPYPGKWPP